MMKTTWHVNVMCVISEGIFTYSACMQILLGYVFVSFQRT